MAKSKVCARSLFAADGYVKSDAVLDESDITDTILALARVRPAASDCFVEERNGQPKQLQNLHTYDEAFFIKRIYHERVLPLARRVVGAEPASIKNVQLFQKHPRGESGPTRVHQDDWYFKLDETCAFAVTCWIALDDADTSGGCLSYAAGSHKHGLLQHKPNVGGCWRVRSGVQGYAGYVDVPLDLLVPVPVKRGDAILHHGRTLHGACANTSENVRRALTFILFFEHTTPEAAQK